MSSLEELRESMKRRLAAAREEISGAFNKTIVDYEKRLDHQYRLRDMVWEPGIKLRSTELPRQQSCKEKEVFTDRQLWNQEINSRRSPLVKDKQEALCTSQEGERLGPKQATGSFMVTPDEENDHSEDHNLLLNPHDTLSAAQKESAVSVPVGSSNSDVLPAAKIKEVKRGAEIELGPKFHFKRPKGKRPHFCKICGKQVTFITQLPCNCKICGKGFKKYGHLSVLMRIDADEKP